MSRRSFVRVATVALASLAAAVGVVDPAIAADVRSESVADRAVAFLASQQRADGGFGEAEAGFPGFETPDVVLALADAAQTDLVPDPVAARNAVRTVKKNGRDGLGYLDDLADGGPDAGKAAQLVLVARAVGLDPRTFDPDGDGATDLLALVDAGRNADGSYDPFYNSTVQAVLALVAVGRTVPSDTIASLQSAQQPGGGYDFTGDPSGSPEIDTTGRVIQALAAAGVPVADPSIAKALALLAKAQNADGSWSAFGSPDPNATAQAILAVEAAGFRSVDACWRAAAGDGGRTVAPPDDFLRGAQAADGRIASSNDSFGINTFATSQSVQALLRSFQPVRRASRAACATTGYRIVTADGGVFTFGDASFLGSTGDLVLNQPIVASATTPSGQGYWLFAADGGVFAFGDAPFLGSTGDRPLNRPIIGAAATPSGGGYWLFAADGGVFTFGDAAFLGSTGSTTLNGPVVAAEASASGRGYWLYAADGGVFTFGDAPFAGSTGGLTLNAPVVAGVSSRPGGGYVLVASDGGVFAFGDARFEGSAAGAPLNAPVVSAFRGAGDGYYLVARDGGVFAFGTPFFGSTGGRSLNAPVVGATL